MDKKTGKIVAKDFDKILDESYKYCKFDGSDKVRDDAIKINKLAYKIIKYVNRYVLKKKSKKK
tara:strand:+ start:1281 stop:1469 length:189 start_codon:yes stop_codon:yes gene_type:complete